MIDIKQEQRKVNEIHILDAKAGHIYRVTRVEKHFPAVGDFLFIHWETTDNFGYTNLTSKSGTGSLRKDDYFFKDLYVEKINVTITIEE